MRRIWMILAGVSAALLLGAPAQAARYYKFHVTGTITTEGPPEPTWLDPSLFPPQPVDLHVGDTVTMHAVFSDEMMISRGVDGFYVPLGGVFYDECGPDIPHGCTDVYPDRPQFAVRANSIAIGAISEINSGFGNTDVVHLPNGRTRYYDYSLPVLFIDENGKFDGFWGNLEPGNGEPNFTAWTSGFLFHNAGLYEAYPNMHTYSGVWNIAGSRLSDVPEPSTWALSILGLWAVGFSLRRRNSVDRRSDAPLPRA